MKRVFCSARFRRLNLPGALLIALLQRTPLVRVADVAGSALVDSPIGDVLRAVITAVASLGAVQSMAGATPLTPSSGSDTGVTVSTGTAVNIGYTVTGTQTLPASWKIQGSIPPGLDFSGLTAPGIVNVVTLKLEGTPTTAGTYDVTITAYEGQNASLIASPDYAYRITVLDGSTNTAPSITTQPQNQNVVVGGSASFSVVATGTPSPTFQWQKDGTAISGATSSTLSLTNVQTTAAGTYKVIVTNSAGSTPSNGATLTVVTTPVITLQPRSQTVTAGGNVTFSVTATGATSYQWQHNGTAVSGATGSSLTLSNVAAADAGNYTVVVTNSVGSVTSAAASFTVSTMSPSGPTAWLSNLSVRANMASGQTMIVGLTTAGGGENILMRADGPALAVVFPTFFSSSSVMADPRLAFYPNGASTASFTNDDWDASLSATFDAVGAFPFTASSKDSAFVQPIDGANNTVWVQGTGPGYVLVEAYALGATNTPRLTNISARNHVGTGADILIAGFVIQGSGTKRLLIRGIGPRLNELFGVQGVLADPKLEIYNSAGTKIAENDNWDSSLSTTFDSVGAYSFTTGSKDAAIVVDLPANASYTAQVKGADGGTGEAVVEVYELP